jgi:hypothetical protein
MAFSTAATTNTDNIPQWLSDLGVVEIQRHQSGYDLLFGFRFADGDTLPFSPYSRISEYRPVGDEFVALLTAAIRKHRSLLPE